MNLYRLNEIRTIVARRNAYLQGMADTAEVSASVMNRDFQPKQKSAPEGLA